MARLTAAQRAAINGISPAVVSSGVNLGDLVDQILSDVNAGSMGIQADAWDVDAVAAANQAFAQDDDTTAGLTFGYQAGKVRFNQSVVEVAAGTVLLTNSAVNYVEVDSAGVVSANVIGFTAGKVRLYKITTGVSSIALVENAKVLLGGMQAAGIPGSLLSAAGATKEILVYLAEAQYTGQVPIPLPNVAGVITGITILSADGLAVSDADYLGFGAVRRGAGGGDSIAVADHTAAVNSTKQTGGSALVANVARSLTLSASAEDLAYSANEALVLVTDVGGEPIAPGHLAVRIDVKFTG